MYCKVNLNYIKLCKKCLYWQLSWSCAFKNTWTSSSKSLQNQNWTLLILTVNKTQRLLSISSLFYSNFLYKFIVLSFNRFICVSFHRFYHGPLPRAPHPVLHVPAQHALLIHAGHHGQLPGRNTQRSQLAHHQSSSVANTTSSLVASKIGEDFLRK
jgi:hypothetical protein